MNISQMNRKECLFPVRILDKQGDKHASDDQGVLRSARTVGSATEGMVPNCVSGEAEGEIL